MYKAQNQYRYPLIILAYHELPLKNIFSDDGYYTLDVGSPESAGTWTIQAASISPLHGIQMAIPQDIVRTKTFNAKFHGIPKVKSSNKLLIPCI